MRQINELFDDFRKTKPLTDAELDALIKHFSIVSVYTKDLGHIFAGSHKYATDVVKDCRKLKATIFKG